MYIIICEQNNTAIWFEIQVSHVEKFNRNTRTEPVSVFSMHDFICFYIRAMWIHTVCCAVHRCGSSPFSSCPSLLYFLFFIFSSNIQRPFVTFITKCPMVSRTYCQWNEIKHSIMNDEYDIKKKKNNRIPFSPLQTNKKNRSEEKVKWKNILLRVCIEFSVFEASEWKKKLETKINVKQVKRRRTKTRCRIQLP